MSVREHGTRARYVHGPAENGQQGKGCRCGPCCVANRAAESHRARMKLYGRWEPYVDAGPAREHVRMLSACGIGWKRVAELSGVSTGALSKLLYGGPGDRPPSRRIRAETAAALLAVEPGALAGHALVDATATRRRLQALVAAGWSQAKLGRRLGVLPSNFGALLRGARITAATGWAVAALYDELWDRRPPQAAHREKIAANRARNYAAARGWPPPAAWDDETIGDPLAGPAEGWQRSARRTLRTADVAEDAAELAAQGFTREQIAGRLGISRAALDQALKRAGAAASEAA